MEDAVRQRAETTPGPSPSGEGVAAGAKVGLTSARRGEATGVAMSAVLLAMRAARRASVASLLACFAQLISCGCLLPSRVSSTAMSGGTLDAGLIGCLRISYTSWYMPREAAIVTTARRNPSGE